MAEPLTTEALRLALTGEFRAAVEAAIDCPLEPHEATRADGAGWGTTITASGALDGQLTVWVDQAGVAAIAKAIMGTEDAPEPSVAAHMLTGLWSQATAAAALRESFDGLTLVGGTPVPGPLPGDGVGLALMDGATAFATLWTTGTVTPGAAVAAAVAGDGASGSDYPGNLAALLDIDLPLVVRFARTEMTLRALSQLAPGSMVDMGRSPDAPVQLLIGSQVVAEGEVVVVAGNYGVRITTLASPAERLRAMEL